MDRVQTLCDKLNEQLKQNAEPEQLLLTVKMIQSELLHAMSASPAKKSSPSVSVHISTIHENSPSPEIKPASPSEKEKPTPEPLKEEEKIIQVLEVDEAEVEAELEEIKRNAEERNKITAQNKPRLLFDPVEDTPTLTHQQAAASAAPPPVPQPVVAERQKELHETISRPDQASLNEKLRQAKVELTDSLAEVPIRDLKKGIGVNDRFLFIRELFRGDETMYERSIKTINGFAIYPEAEYWIKRELKLKLGWDDRNEVVRQFDQLIKRRFS